MSDQDIILKLKEKNLLGRGGAAYPVWKKWQIFKDTKADKKYIVCNASEGEPDILKDGFILENYPQEVINGIKIALEMAGNASAFIYLNKNYYKKLGKKLKNIIGDLPITLFEKTGGYIAGEETTVLSSIEGEIQEPRLRPPFPCEVGLWGYPTLVNNVETFYYVSQIAKDNYKNTRFYSLSGDIKNKGVYELPLNLTIKQVLEKTNNLPKFYPVKSSLREVSASGGQFNRVNFFIQAGGGVSGEILLSSELDRNIEGSGGIIVFNRQKTNLFSLMNKWADFLVKGNCDKCVPCREGIYRIKELLKDKKIDKKILDDLFFVLEKTSFCPLGRGVVLPFNSLISKLLK